MIARTAAAALLLASLAAVAQAQPYPIRPVRMVTSEAGGGSDFIARVVGQGLSGALGQQVIVDNRGMIGAEITARAAPDGYTIMLYGSPLWLSPVMRDKVPYDPEKDFAPLTILVTTPNILVVHPSVPVKNAEELIALARSKPGDLNYGAGSAGSTQHLAAELFKAMARVNIVRIPFKGSGPALNGVIAGQVQVMFPSAGSAGPHIRSGRLKALAVSSAQPSALAPGLPPLATSGVPGYESSSPFGLFAPAGTPAALVNQLSQATVRMLNTPDTRERLFNSGVEVVASTPAQLGALVRSEMAKWGKLVREAGLREE